MRLTQWLVVVALLLSTPAIARADVLSLYLQAHQGVAGERANDLMPGRASEEMGRGFGLQAGVKVLVFEAYVDKTHYDGDAALTHAVVGLRTGVEQGRLRAYARAGVGMVEDESGLLVAHRMSQGKGAVARAGVGLAAELTSRVFLVLSVDGEYFAFEPVSGSTEVQSGSAFFGGLGLRFALGQ
jgi:hypothetical protein